MKLPGKAMLTFEITPLEGNASILILKSLFSPRGLFGIFYWYALRPFHAIFFQGLLKEIRKRAETSN